MRTQIMWWIGMGATGVGSTLAFAGAWAAAAGCFAGGAVLLWLSGGWLLPWSREAYLRRVGNAWTTWTIEAQWAYDRQARPPSKRARGLEHLTPPPEFEDEHVRLMALRDEYQRMSQDDSARRADRSRDTVAAQLAFAETKDRLTAGATTDAQRRYAATLGKLLNARLAEYAATSRKAEEAAEKAIRSFARMRVPAAAAREHAALLEAFSSHLDAVREFHAAMSHSRDPARAAAATDQLDLAAERLGAAAEAVSGEPLTARA